MRREAQRCLTVARIAAVTAMIVPSPYGLAGDAFMASLIDSGYLGNLRELHVHSLNDQLADPKTPMGWRQITKLFRLQHANAWDRLRDGAALGSRRPARLAYASKMVRNGSIPSRKRRRRWERRIVFRS